MRQILLKRIFFLIGAGFSAILFFSCAGEPDYPQQAKEFYSNYAKSPEINWLVRFNIKPRQNDLYIQQCQRAPEDTTKMWAIYENFQAEKKFEFAQLKVAWTPFSDSGGRRVIPDYQAVYAADTTEARGKSLLELREVVQAFQKLGLREVICAGPNVTYLVHRKFMLVYVFDPGQTPASIKNIAAKLDENWYYQISFEHQDEQRRKFSTVLREFLESLQSPETQEAQTDTNK
jgi:hypothetical protein